MELSKRVAELYGIEPQNLNWDFEDGFSLVDTYLHEDSAGCFDLMTAYAINCAWYEDEVIVSCFNAAKKHMAHGVSIQVGDAKMVALRTAILQCLIKMKEG